MTTRPSPERASIHFTSQAMSLRGVTHQNHGLGSPPNLERLKGSSAREESERAIQVYTKALQTIRGFANECSSEFRYWLKAGYLGELLAFKGTTESVEEELVRMVSELRTLGSAANTEPTELFGGSDTSRLFETAKVVLKELAKHPSLHPTALRFARDAATFAWGYPGSGSTLGKVMNEQGELIWKIAEAAMEDPEHAHAARALFEESLSLFLRRPVHLAVPPEPASQAMVLVSRFLSAPVTQVDDHYKHVDLRIEELLREHPAHFELALDMSRSLNTSQERDRAVLAIATHMLRQGTVRQAVRLVEEKAIFGAHGTNSREYRVFTEELLKHPDCLDTARQIAERITIETNRDFPSKVEALCRVSVAFAKAGRTAESKETLLSAWKNVSKKKDPTALAQGRLCVAKAIRESGIAIKIDRERLLDEALNMVIGKLKNGDWDSSAGIEAIGEMAFSRSAQEAQSKLAQMAAAMESPQDTIDKTNALILLALAQRVPNSLGGGPLVSIDPQTLGNLIRPNSWDSGGVRTTMKRIVEASASRGNYKGALEIAESLSDHDALLIIIEVLKGLGAPDEMIASLLVKTAQTRGQSVIIKELSKEGLKNILKLATGMPQRRSISLDILEAAVLKIAEVTENEFISLGTLQMSMGYLKNYIPKEYFEMPGALAADLPRLLLSAG